MLGHVILASKDVLSVLMQFFTNQMIFCLKCVKSYLKEMEEEDGVVNSCLLYRISAIILA